MKNQTVKIGYRDFQLLFADKLETENMVGSCNATHGIIEIEDNRDCVEHTNTILHEILHAIFHTQGAGLSAKEEERIVNIVANGLTQVLRDNSDFIQSVLDDLYHPNRSNNQ